MTHLIAIMLQLAETLKHTDWKKVGRQASAAAFLIGGQLLGFKVYTDIMTQMAALQEQNRMLAGRILADEALLERTLRTLCETGKEAGISNPDKNCESAIAPVLFERDELALQLWDKLKVSSDQGH